MTSTPLRSTTIRPSLANVPGSPSPHTPTRALSSSYASPSSTLRPEEGPIVFELGHRFFRAGLGDSVSPACTFSFGPEEQRRVGDYRQWEIGYESNWRKRKRGREWGEPHELWKMDLRGVDLGLVADKIERAIREALDKYIMTESRSRKWVVAVNPDLPHPLITTMLSVMFNSGFNCSGAVLMSSPVLTTLSSGLRSALVIDIGWRETTVSGIFEFREVRHIRSDRAAKWLGKEMCKLLATESRKARGVDEEDSDDLEEAEDPEEEVSFEETEEVLARMAWCQSYSQARIRSASSKPIQSGLNNLTISEDRASPQSEDPVVSIPLSSPNPPTTLQLPMSRLAEPVENALFSCGVPDDGVAGGGDLTTLALEQTDDNELPIHLLAYRCLASLPKDVRGSCMSRIVVTGGVSNIPGIKTRLVEEIAALHKERGWDTVYGKAADAQRKRLKELTTNSQLKTPHSEAQKATNYTDDPNGATSPAVPAGLAEQESNPVDDHLRREQAKLPTPPYVKGVVRGVESLGPWAGASLIGPLRVKVVAEISRDDFTGFGLPFPTKDPEVIMAPLLKGPAAPQHKPASHIRSTLGAWE